MTATAVGLAPTVLVLVSLESGPLPVSTDFGAPFLLSSSPIDGVVLPQFGNTSASGGTFVVAVGLRFAGAILSVRFHRSTGLPSDARRPSDRSSTDRFFSACLTADFGRL